MTPHPQPPKEYIITEAWVKDIYAAIKDMGYPQTAESTASMLRSRPHPAPAFKRCCDSCINVPCKVLNRVPCLAQEKQENVCEENGCTDIENCDEICQHSRLFSPLQMQEAKGEAARKAREDVLKPIKDIHERFKHLDAILSKRDPDCPMMMCYVDIWEAVKESLRSTQHQAGDP